MNVRLAPVIVALSLSCASCAAIFTSDNDKIYLIGVDSSGVQITNSYGKFYPLHTDDEGTFVWVQGSSDLIIRRHNVVRRVVPEKRIKAIGLIDALGGYPLVIDDLTGKWYSYAPLDVRFSTTDTSQSIRLWKPIISVGIGLGEPVQQVPLLWTHYELTTGVDYSSLFQIVARYEGSNYIDPFGFKDLNYNSSFSASTIGIRFFPLGGIFLTSGWGYAKTSTDSAYAFSSKQSYPGIQESSPVLFGGVGWCGDVSYIEVRDYFGTRKIQVFDRSPVSVHAITIGFGVYVKW